MEIMQATTRFVSHLVGLAGFVIAWAAVLLAGENRRRLDNLDRDDVRKV